MNKILLFSLVLNLFMVSCSNNTKTVSGEEMLQVLNEKGLSLMVYKDDSLSQYHQSGVKDLLNILNTDKEGLKDAIIADKMIGKAAASIMIVGGVKEVHTNLICTPALQFLNAAHINTHYKEQVPMILNKDKSGKCPIDSRIDSLTDPTRCVEVLQQWFGINN